MTAMNNWHDPIFAYFDHPITNAYTESANNLIRDRRARPAVRAGNGRQAIALPPPRAALIRRGYPASFPSRWPRRYRFSPRYTASRSSRRIPM